MYESPMVILDLGTATTLTAINEKGELCGVLIIPGIRSSLNALSAQAAELPRISLEKPKAFLGKNTIDSMMSGIVYGNAAMMDGLLDRIKEEWKVNHLTVIATGGLADIILPYCRPGTVIHPEANLTLQGLRIIHRLNVNRKI
jgi:type III pantothenate kinase